MRTQRHFKVPVNSAIAITDQSKSHLVASFLFNLLNITRQDSWPKTVVDVNIVKLWFTWLGLLAYFRGSDYSCSQFSQRNPKNGAAL